jgi:F0F1-type ATP synthase membrane subunit b/b'
LFFRGQAKGKYRRNPEAVTIAERQLKTAEKLVADLNGELKKAESTVASSSTEAKAGAEKVLADLKAKVKEAEAQKTAADATLKQATDRAKPQEVTITVYSAPIRIRVSEDKKVASIEKK